MNDRSLADQIGVERDQRRFRSKLRICPISSSAAVRPSPVAVRHAAHRVVGAGDHLVARPYARHHFEILVAGDPHLDRDELGACRRAPRRRLPLPCASGPASAPPPTRPYTGAGLVARRRAACFGRAAPSRPGRSRRNTSSRTATAGIGTDTTSLRVAVVMSAVQVKPGRDVRNRLVEHHRRP